MGSNLKSLQIEKHLISGLINNPQVFPDIEKFVSENDFTASPHNVIFSCIRSYLLKNSKVDIVLLAQNINNLGIHFREDLSIFEYIESISFTKITPEATIAAAQELVKLRMLRDIDKKTVEIQNYIQKSVSQDINKTIVEIDSIYANTINSFVKDDGEKDLFAGIPELVEERGNNPIEEIGLSTPYPEFNRLYGGLRNMNLYVIAARAKAGKSNWLMETSSEISRIHKIPVLYLDTELSTQEVRFRTIAAKSGVGLWYIETGNWRKNEELTKRIRETNKKIEFNYNVTHYFIGNRSIQEVVSIVRRWYLKYVKRSGDGKCLICFDYVKMMDALSKNQQEYQLMGEKIDMLKKLAEELNCPIITAVQTNRSGITNNRDVSEIVDDESSIGISDRISWYASYVGILRRKVSEEIILDTPESGTHKLIEAVSRWQGKDAAGHQDMIARIYPHDKKKRYVKNYINFQIENFKVEERGSLKDCIIRQNSQFKAVDESKNQEYILQ